MVPFVFDDPRPLAHVPFASGEGRRDGRGAGVASVRRQRPEAARSGREISPRTAIEFGWVRESQRGVAELDGSSVVREVVDVDLFAGHVCEQLGAVRAEGQVGRGDGWDAPIAHRLHLRLRVRQIPGRKIRQAPHNRTLAQDVDRLGEGYDPPVVETDEWVERSHGDLFGSDGVDGHALALREGGVRVTGRLQVDQDVATGAVSKATVGLPKVQLPEESIRHMHSTVQYSVVQCSTVQYSTVQYSTVQYSTVQYSTV